ncbi:MAG: aspartyl/asparaginyl beta-hydroxylase domain-containing protein [Pseudomonadota bacterium]
MDIAQTLNALGPVDIASLSSKILAFDSEVWREEQLRQKKYSEVHYNTESVIVIFCDHDDWPNIDVIKGNGWDRLAEVALPVMHGIIGQHYTPGGTIIRAMAAKLTAGTTITPHTDNHPSFRSSHRVHIPITTNRKVRFMIDGRPHRLDVGQAYEINNQKRHSVINGGDEDRITFIFDYIPGHVKAQPAIEA